MVNPITPSWITDATLPHIGKPIITPTRSSAAATTPRTGRGKGAKVGRAPDRQAQHAREAELGALTVAQFKRQRGALAQQLFSL